MQKEPDWLGIIVTLLNSDSMSGSAAKTQLYGLRLRMQQICSSSYDELIIFWVSWALRGCGENVVSLPWAAHSKDWYVVGNLDMYTYGNHRLRIKSLTRDPAKRVKAVLR